MSCDQEYTIYFLQGPANSLFPEEPLALQENKQFQIPLGNKSVFSFTKLMILAVYLKLILEQF